MSELRNYQVTMITRAMGIRAPIQLTKSKPEFKPQLMPRLFGRIDDPGSADPTDPPQIDLQPESPNTFGWIAQTSVLPHARGPIDHSLS